MENAVRLEEWYRHHAEQHGFVPDESQRRAIAHLQRLYDDLAASGRRGWLARLFGDGKAVRRLYLWGGVGRARAF